MVLPFLVYVPLFLIIFFGDFWLPFDSFIGDLPPKLTKEHIERFYIGEYTIFTFIVVNHLDFLLKIDLPYKYKSPLLFVSERCSPYSSHPAFHQFLIHQFLLVFLLVLIIMSLCMCICCPRQRDNPRIEYLSLSLAILVCLAISCICIQISSAMTCRPIEIIFDFRFLSVLSVQLIGFIGCLLFAVKLGVTYAIEIPIQILADKVSLAPYSR